MGCGNSTDGKGEDGEKGFFHRRPKVSIRVGNSVKLSTDETTIVFIFGKPCVCYMYCTVYVCMVCVDELRLAIYARCENTSSKHYVK